MNSPFQNLTMSSKFLTQKTGLAQTVLPVTNDPESELLSPTTLPVHVLRNQARGHLSQPPVAAIQQCTNDVPSEVANQCDSLLHSR